MDRRHQRSADLHDNLRVKTLTNHSHHGRFEFSAIADRPKVTWPNDARVAVWIIPNVEHFHFNSRGPMLDPSLATLFPDVQSYGWRDYGVRVGFWRLNEIIQKHGFKGTLAINSDVCEFYPRIIEEASRVGWEFLAHGASNSKLLTDLSEADEEQVIQTSLNVIKSATGRSPRGWLSPVLSESLNTLDILARNGVEYVADWTNDEQPYEMNVKSGRLFAMPYSLESNDYPAFLNLNQSPESFGRTLKDQFDVLYDEGKESGRVMAICLHPFITGHPHRAKYIDDALAYISKKGGAWKATGSEILDWFKSTVAT